MILSPDELRARVERYFEVINSRDPDAIAAVMAPNATFEDPVGTPALVGRDAVRTMFQEAAKTLQAMKLTRVSPISVAGNCAAFALIATTEMAGVTSEIDVIDLQTYDDAGLITSMRAFWNFGDVRTTSTSS